MIARRALIRTLALVTGLVGSKRAGAAPHSLPAQPPKRVIGSAASGWVLPGDFLAPEGGEVDARGPLQQAIDASARFRRPLQLNGVYRLDGPLLARSDMTIEGTGTLRAMHSGALIESDGGLTTRTRIEGLRLEAGTEVRRAIDGQRWQYAMLRDLRLMSAGGVFREGIGFEQTAYWNRVSDLEGEAVQTLFVLSEANNLVLDTINWCRFSDIGMKQFAAFTGPCSGMHGRALSLEGVFRDTTLIKLRKDCTGIDLEFLRVEGRQGSKAVAFLDFNGARGNWLRLPPAFFGIDRGGLANESGNFVSFLGANGSGVFHMGTGQAVLPLSGSDPTLPGALSYNPQTQRLRVQIERPHSVVLTPAVETLEMAGQAISGARSIALQGGAPPRPPEKGAAILFLEPRTGALCVMFDDGRVKKITPRDGA